MLAVVSRSSMGWLMFMMDYRKVCHMLRMNLMSSLNHCVSMVNYWHRMVYWNSVDNSWMVHGGMMAFSVVGFHWMMGNGVMD